MIAALIAGFFGILEKVFGIYLGHKTDVAVQSGVNQQALKDEESANAITNEVVAAAAAGDQRRLFDRDAPADTSKPDPDLPYRD